MSRILNDNVESVQVYAVMVRQSALKLRMGIESLESHPGRIVSFLFFLFHTSHIEDVVTSVTYTR